MGMLNSITDEVQGGRVGMSDLVATGARGDQEPLNPEPQQQTQTDWSDPSHPSYAQYQEYQQTKTQLEEAKKTLGRFEELYSPLQQQEQQRIQQAREGRINDVTARLRELGADPDEVTVMSQVVKDGLEWQERQQELGTMAKERLSLIEGIRSLGGDAKVSDLVTFAQSLMQYNDPTLMREAAKMRAEGRRTQVVQQLATQQQPRFEGGGRTVSGLDDFDSLETRIASEGLGALSQNEFARYNQLRKDRGMWSTSKR